MVSNIRKLQFVDVKDVSSGFAAKSLVGALLLVSTQFKFTFNSINHYNLYKSISDALESLSHHGLLPKTVGRNSLMKDKEWSKR
ncbi:hypothetical protein AVEN_256858-1, partial [Araneus ventricosus]